jgi:TPR repeat protein
MARTRVILANTLAAAAIVTFAFSVSTVASAGDDLDRAKSLERVRQQGERGEINAQFALGFMYEEGGVKGVPQDYSEAARWYRLAADQGYYAAMHELGLMYFDGKGVPQDYVTAYMWLNLAAARSPAWDTNAAKARDLITSRMTREQIAEGQKLARQWVPR